MRQGNSYFLILLFFFSGFCSSGLAKNIYVEGELHDGTFENKISEADELLNCSFTVSANIVEADCQNGGGIGEIDLTVVGGTSPFSYNWSNGETTQDITGLDAGVYAVTIEDGTGCQTVEYYQVSSGAGQTRFNYFIPLAESDIHTNFYNFTSVWIPYFPLSNSIRTIISVVATGDNTIITYDHWEDGQESDISNPSQSTTQIWGDGNAANGIPPGFSTDILNAGDVIALDNVVYLPRSASTLKYDGRDHISATEQLAVSRAAWGPDPGPVLSGAVEILEKNAFGTYFEIPIGEDISSDQMFQKVGLSVMAGENFTLVQIDTDGNGSNDVSQVLNKGETYYHNGGIESGATISASQPIQAHLLTGDVYALFEARWFTLFPYELWDDSYYNPIGSTVATDPADVFIYNPNNSSLTVFVETQLGTSNFSISSKDVYRYEMPMNSGAHFYTNNRKEFFALSTIDSDIQDDNDAHDWGFTLMPETYLTTSATIGYGPGNNGLTGNGSPAWVTSTQATTLYVDYDGNPNTGALTDPKGNKYDIDYSINAFESRRIFDPNDNDQTGMYLYTLDGTLIAVAWGQDPATAAPGNPYLDFGTAVPPIRKIDGWKDYVLKTDYDGDGNVDPGDVIEFSLYLENAGNTPVFGITVTDQLPGEITYVGGTTDLNGSAIPDDGSGSLFPVDELGFYISSIPVNETYVITYQTTANPMPPVYSEIINGFTAFVTDPCQTISGEITLPVETPPATSSCALFLTNVGGGAVGSYQINGEVCFQLADADQNLNGNVAETVSVTLENNTTNDTETVVLTETGNSTGVFTGCITSSTTLGTSDEDGTFYATEGSSISSSFTDGTNGDMCSDNAVFEAESFVKQLYLTDSIALDRIDPVSTSDNTTATLTMGTGVSSSNNMAVYATGGATVKYREWNGSSLGSEEVGVDHGAPFHYMQSASAPTRDEAILVGITSDFNIRGQLWDGTQWSALPFSPMVDLGSGLDYWQVDIAYEQQSGDAVIVWDNATNGSTGLSYRVWNGSTWTAEATITVPLTGDIENLRLSSKPGSDEIILVASASSSDYNYALVWDGSSWGNSVSLDNNLSSDHPTNIGVAYMSQSGTGMAAFGIGSNTSLSYKTWNGASWSSTAIVSAASGVTARPKFVTLNSDPNSDRLVLGVLTQSDEIWYAVYDGSSWGSKVLVTSSAGDNTVQNLFADFEASSGDILAVYATSSGTEVLYRTFDGSSWSAEQTGPDLGHNPRTMVLYPNPSGDNDQIMMAGHDSAAQPNYTLWDGTSWGTPTQVATSAGNSRRQPFTFIWFGNSGGGSGGSSGASFKRQLTINNSAQSENLTDFPILITLNSSRIDYLNTQDAGEDLRFYDSDGTTQLPHEIEEWDESGTSYVWVKVPQIDGSSNSDFIWMEYGDPSSSDGQDKANVWDANFKGVWHLDETSGNHEDATSNNNDGVPGGSPNQDVVGKIGGTNDFGGLNDRVEIPPTTLSGTTDFSLEAWIKTSGSTDALPIIQQKDPSNYFNTYNIRLEGNTGNLIYSVINEYEFNSVSSLSDDQWHHVVGVRDGTIGRIYVDGVLESSQLSNGIVSVPNDVSVWIGGNHRDSKFFDGLIDEPRISNVARSADWIAAQYLSMTDAMITYGSEEAITGGSSSSTFSSRIAAYTDDAEEEGLDGMLTAPGTMYINSADLELVRDDENPTAGAQTIGLRFNNINIPQGVTITNASLTFTAETPDSGNSNSGTANYSIQAENSDNSNAFGTGNFYFTNLPKTTASVAWSPTSWTPETEYTSPDLASIVQEVVNRGGWASGNSMTFMITGTGSRSAYAYDTDPSKAPLLTIEYGTGSSSSSAVFTQTIPMCSDLDLPAGGTITIENYINDLAGNLPASPDVNAVLKQDGTTIATLTNPTYNGISLLGYGNAIAGASGSGVVGTEEMLGAADDVGGQIYYDNTHVIIDLGEVLPSGSSYSVFVRQACVGDDSYYQIEESENNSTYYVNSTSPRVETSAWFTEHSYTMENSTRYLKIVKTAGACIQVDAVSYSYLQGGDLLSWSYVLPSDVTINAGAEISLELVNNEAGASFEILYDSETYPSVIKLPTTTVIKIEDFAIFDAPYPGGTEIVEFEADGTTVYLRTTASDPFGTEDITEIDFEITAPGGGSTIYAGVPVDSSGCEKTFEYPWTIPLANGNYDIAAYAKEGYEQTVIDTIQTSINIDPPDPSAPCNLTFIDQDRNAAPNFIIEQTVCLRLEDSNNNKDDNVAESIIVTLVTNSGDSEVVNLIETGLATGIFENCISASSLSGSSQNDGTLNAVENDVIAVTHFVDDEDCNAFANVLAEPAQTKVLYLSGANLGMDRIDPVATGDNTTNSTFELGLTANMAGYVTEDWETLSYSGGSGWAANWMEINDNNIATTGDARVLSSSYCPSGICGRVGVDSLDDSRTVTNSGFYRDFDLSTATYAELSFNYKRRYSSVQTPATVQVQLWNTSLGGYETVETITINTTDASSQLTGYALTADQMSASSSLRFLFNGTIGEEETQALYIDNIGLKYIGSSSPGATTFTTTGDALISSQNTTANYGTSNNNLVGPYSGGSQEWHTVMKFDLSSLAGQEIGNADLKLSIRSTTNAPITVEVYRITTDWDEGTVTWASPWSSSGGDFDQGVLHASTDINSSIALGDPTEEMSFNITNLVRGWLDGTYPNYGLILTSPEVNASINMHSLQGTTPPVIEISTGNSVNFEQTPDMCYDFNVLAGETVTVETYVNVTSGTMPTNPDITANLYLDDVGNSLLTLNNPTYSGGKLTWTGTLGSNQTVPGGQAVGLEVSTNQSGVNFEILYDDQNYPSAVHLPTNTVILATDLNIYKNTYPDLTTISGVTSGDSVYIRTTVGDPFGAYDINYVDMRFTSPTGMESTVRLTDDDVVDAGACVKIYEHLWIAPDEEGEVTIKAIAQEGYESIQDSIITTTTITRTDLGTNCVIEFLDNTDMGRTTYDPDEQICLEIIDFDKNADELSVETVQMTLESDAGDFETLTLTETGANTGIFKYCISASATVSGADEDDSIYAPAVSTIFAEYVDPDDESDICTQIVTINSFVPAVAISKTLTTPSDGNALPGETIVFEINVSNPGPTTLETVFVGDVFDNACLSYQSASITPDYAVGDSLNWTNIGPIASGDSKSIDVTFSASAACNPARNIANTDAVDIAMTPVSAGPDTAELVIANPEITVSKTIIAPVAANILVGAQVTYEIQITNTGNTTITTLPVFDTYSNFCQSFISSSITPDDNSGGSIVWNDIGPLASGGMITFTVVLEAINPCSPAKNTVEIFFATDEYGNGVPRVSDEAEIPVIVPPIAVDDYETTNENTAVVINVPDNDYDFNFDLDLTSVDMSGLQQPDDGTITSINGTTGEITYTPNNGFIGNDTFVYQICDLTALCDTATVYIEIIEPPVEICDDGEDNDGDGLADCLDADCLPVINSLVPNNPTCPDVDNGTITVFATGSNLMYSSDNGASFQSSNVFSGLLEGSYNIIVQNSATGCQTVYSGNPITLSNPFCAEICNDGIDNDGDMLIDCEDPDCDDLTVNISKDTTICDGDAKLLEVELVNCANTCTAGSTVTSFPYATSFENTFDDWTQMSGHDLPWSVNSGATPSSGTGPSAASAGSYYIYIEASTNPYDGYPNKVSGIESPCFDLLNYGGAQLTFDYHMFGTAVGTLELEITENDGGAWTNIWSDTGSQGDSWQNASVNLSGYVGKIVRLRFVGTTGSGWSSDMCIDNLGISASDFTYAWNTSPVETTPSITVSPTMTTTYLVTITDGLGQEIIDSTTVTVNACTEICTDGIDNDGDFLVDCDDPDCGQPSLTNVIITHPDNCPDLDNGTVVISASGVNLEYSVDNGMTYQSSNTFSNLTPGSYNVVVRNSVSLCEVSFSGNPFNLNMPNCPEICDDGIDNDGDLLVDCDDPDCAGSLSVTLVPNDDICEGTGGSIDLTAAGTGPFTYVWDDMLPDAQWNFDESTDDVSGNGNNQNVANSLGVITYSTDAVQGTHSAYFDGGDYIRYSQDGAFMEVAFTNLSFSVWIKPDDLVGLKMILDEGGGTNGLGLRLNDNLLEGAIRNGGVQFNAGSIVFPADGQWHHVGLVYEGGDFTIYLDGVPGATTSTAANYSAISSHSGNGGLGYQDGASGFGGSPDPFFTGHMDDARLYLEKALTDAQFLDLARNDGDRTNLSSGTYSVSVTDGSECLQSVTDATSISNTGNVSDGGSIAASQSICTGETPTAFTSIAPASGGLGGAITYQWQSSLDNTVWTNISGATGLTYASGVLTQTTYYRRNAFRDGCSLQIPSDTLIVTVVDNLTDPGVISGDETQCGSYNPSTINSVSAGSGGSGGSIEYQWQSSPDGSTGWSDISGAITESFDPPVVASTTYFRRGARRNPCAAWDYTSTVIKTVVINYTDGGTIEDNEAECDAFDPAEITEVTAPSGGSGGSLIYTWEQNVNSGGWTTISGAIGASYDPPMISQTTEYRRGARRMPCTDLIYSNTVTKTISNSSPANISTFPSGSLCENTNYSFTAADAGAGSTYAWDFGAYATPATATGQGPHNVTFDVPIADYQTDFEVILNTVSGLCSGADTVDISVRPELIIANINGTNPTACGAMDGELEFFVTAPTGADFQISLDGGSTWEAMNQTMFTGLAAGTFQVQIRYFGGDCPVDWGVIALEDPFLPTSAIFQDYTTECLGETFEFEALFNFFITGYAWDFGPDATPSTATGVGPHFVTYAGTGNKTVTLTVSGFGCSKDYNELFTLTENFTDGGSIEPDQVLCGTFDPAEITSSASPSGGGAGTIDYQWEYRIDDGMGDWDDWIEMVGATGETYDPISISEPTQYRRKARNLPCTDWLFSNVVTVIPSGTPTAIGDSYSSVCPGNSFGEDLILNDVNIFDPEFTVRTAPTNGELTIFEDGQFLYIPNSTFCGTDQFIYEVCNSGGVCCDTAIVNLILTDTEAPMFTNIPADITITCDEDIPIAPSVVAIENCLSVSISLDEISTQGIDGCSLNDYQITRIWTATDYCGNSTTDSQIITIEDKTAPDIYRIYTLPNGKKMVAGITERVNENWKHITMPITFPTNPIIFTQLNSEADASAATVRIRNVSTSQFDMQLSEEEASDNLHGRESVAWIAIEPGVQSTGDIFEVGSLILTDAVSNQSFTQDFGSDPGFLASVQTRVETDPVVLRQTNLTGTGVDLNLQEETSDDAEVAHLDETAGYFVFENTGDFTLETGEVIGESGKTNATVGWTTIPFSNTYNNPVVVANAPGNNDSDPVFVRIKDVTPTEFKIKLQEWDYQDGVHISEEVTWFVVEGSIPLGEEVPCEAVPTPLAANTEIIAVDNCDLTIMLNYSETLNTNSCAPNNEIIRTWSATDDCGNSTMFARTITVIDTIPPDFTVPAEVSITCVEDIDDLTRTGDVTDETDNCATGIEATYADIFNGTFNCDSAYVVQREWTLTDGCGNSVTKTQIINVRFEGVTLQAKVRLQGAMFQNGGDGLMRDDLRQRDMIPLVEPFNAMSGFQHVGEGGEEVINSSVFLTTGDDAIVDWVFVEIRDPNNPSLVVNTRAGLLQRDGDIVDVDGTSPLAFNTLFGGSYHVAVRHRNHLGIMTKEVVAFTGLVPAVADFTDAATECWGIEARRTGTDGSMEMWGGDYNGDRTVIYQGGGNDISSLFVEILTAETNVDRLVNFIYESYNTHDFDLDGDVILQGPNNEKAKLFYHVVLNHPGNAGKLVNYVVTEQLP